MKQRFPRRDRKASVSDLAKKIFIGIFAASFVLSPLGNTFSLTAHAQTADASGATAPSSGDSGAGVAPTPTSDTPPPTTIGNFSGSTSGGVIAPPPADDLGTATTPAIDTGGASSNNSNAATVAPPSGKTGSNISLSPDVTGESSLPIVQPIGYSSFNSSLVTIDKNTGALTTEYPITVPPGRKGMQPNLDFVYNSQQLSQGSIVGEGWSINIPYIQRINKNGVDNLYSTSTQNYFLSSADGELASTTVSSTYIARTDNGSFNSYKFSNGSWIMTDKNGTQFIFGSSTAAQQNDPNNSANVYRWMLEKVIDTNSNYITYSYFKDAGQIYPSSTVYTGNGTSTGIFEVDFLRASSTDNATSSQLGFSVHSNYRINEVDAKVSGNLVRKYALGYGVGDNGSSTLLTSITESGEDSSGHLTTLPPVNFSYQPQTAGWTSTSTWDPSETFMLMYNNFNDDEGERILDLNGDNLADTIAGNDIGATFYSANINNGNGWTDASSTWDSPQLFVSDEVTDSNRPGDTGLRIADVNGDGLADLISGYNDGTTSTFVTYLNNGHGWTTTSTWNPPLPFSNQGSDTGLRIADLNGDGLPDLIYGLNDGTGNHFAAYINNGHGWTDASSTWDPPLVFSQSGNDSGLRIADVNGDGLDDLISGFAQGTSSTFATYLNTGHGWSLDSIWNSPLIFQDYNQDIETGVRIADLNGDGLPDLTSYYIDPSGNPFADAYINNGHGWTDASSTWDPPHPFSQETFSFHGDPGERIFDVNGDGLPDIVGAVNWSGTPTYYSYLNNNIHAANLLTGIAYSQGATSTIQYKSATQYTDGSGNTLNKEPYSVYVVSSVTTNDGLNNLSSSTYQYASGTYYYATPFDREFAGFGLVTETDAAGNVTKTYYHTGNGTDSAHGEFSDDFWKIGKPYRVEQYDNAGHLYKKTINKWDIASLGGNAAFVKLDQTTEEDYDGLGTHNDKAEAYTYDNTNGNQTEKITYGQVTGADDGSFTDTGNDKFTIDTTFASSTTGVIGLPSDVITTNQSSTKIKETQYIYDGLSLGNASSGNMTKQSDWKTGSTYITTVQNTYNSFGLVTQSLDPRNNTTTYTYDSFNLYPATTTNALSQTTGYQYDYSTGKPTQVTDPNSNPTKTSYDGFGRVLQILQPDPNNPPNVATKTIYSYVDTANAVSVHEADYLSVTTSVDTYSYYDGLGRLIQARKSSEDSGVYKVTDHAYNSLGLVQKESLPYFGNGTSSASATTTTSLFTNYTYDALQRPLTIGNAVGTTTYSYANWKTTITDARGKQKDQIDDAYGNLIQVNEYNGTSTYSTFYNYDGLNDLTKLTDALSNIRNFTYDGLGRRLTAQDLHASADSTFGTWNYTYDDAGNLTQTVDPKNQTTTYNYDSLNRVVSESFGGQTQIAYTYDSCTQGKGRLCVASSSDAITSSTYNSLGQLIQESKTIAGTAYTTSYTYDRQGNKLTITNPDNSVEQYTYDTAGLTETVAYKENGGSFSNVVNNFNYSPTDQPSFIAYANGVNATNTYDPTKLYRLTAKVSASGGTNLQNIAYTYDADGNITQIVDTSGSGTGKTVNYTYDDLSRLTVASTTNVSTTPSYSQIFTYDAIGNITSGPSGIYSYAGNTGTSEADPDAVTSISPSSTTQTAVIFDASSSYNPTTASTTFSWPITVTSTANRVLLAAITGMPANNTSTAASYNGSAMTLLLNGGNVNARMQLWYLLNPASGTHNVSITLATATAQGIGIADSFANTSGVGFSNPWLDQSTSSLVFVTSTHNDVVVDFLDVLDHTLPDPTAGSGQKVLVSSSTASGNSEGASGYINATTTGFALVNEVYNFSTSSFWHGDEVDLVAATSTTGTSTSFTYDNDGNLLTTGTATDTWNYKNELTQIVNANGTSTYGYDYLGERVKVSNGSTTTYYPETTYNISGSTKTKDIFADGLLVGTVQGGGGPVLFDASSSYNPTVASTTYSFPITVTSTASRVLLATITGMSNTNTSTAASYNGTPMTLLLDNGNVNTRMQLWYLLNPASGTHNVSITLATSSAQGIGIADSFANISGIGFTNPWMDQGTSTWVFVTSTINDIVADFINVHTHTLPDPTAASGQTVLVSTSTATGANEGAAGYINATTTGYALLNEFYNLSTTTFWQGYDVDLTAPSSSVTSYVLTDNLGGTNVVTNASGTAIEVLDYYPYGGIRMDNRTGSTNESRKYIGQEYDGATQLSYLNARYYNSAQGQFISQDPVFLAVGDPKQITQISRQKQDLFLSDPQSLNSYSYSEDNPITKSDPTGKFSAAAIQAQINNIRAEIANLQQEITSIGGSVGGAVGSGAGKAVKVVQNHPYIAGTVAVAGVIAGGWALGAGALLTEGTIAAAAAACEMLCPITEEIDSTPAISNNAESNADNFFENTTDDPRLSGQIDAYHSFPNIVRNFASNGTIGTITGGDGSVYSTLSIPGGYNNEEGIFEFIKDSGNVITHSFFSPNE